MAASGQWLPDYLTQQSSQHSLHMLREHVCSLVSARTLATLLIHPPVPTSKHPSPPEPICPFQGLTQVTWLSYLLVIVPKWTSLLKPPPVCSGLADCALNPLPWTLCEDLPSPSYHPSLMSPLQYNAFLLSHKNTKHTCPAGACTCPLAEEQTGNMRWTHTINRTKN